ncbi:hypothetical protein CANCADRAFT_318 [Tortispora caseinolytica NRRL Y-17796]|uniref:Uncharacterized protein n=1 Tax=Tortispora caseinolytica NRRL Y-17796 TaxID=767744 RepID=A0A1E4TJ43_9ASCO|nr:hypothetical protein CANCADRAFT_318 [Tortispora caseinolytica NRRL Y-17796]
MEITTPISIPLISNHSFRYVDSSHFKRQKTRVPRNPTSWDPHDDILLRHLKEQLKLGWKEIASHFVNRTPNACQFRWRRLMSGSLRLTYPPVSSPPEAILQELGHSIRDLTPKSYGNSDLAAVAAHRPSTSRIKQLPPSLLEAQLTLQKSEMQPKDNFAASKESPRAWSIEEDEVVRRADLRIDEISVLLPNRTETEIRARIEINGSLAFSNGTGAGTTTNMAERSTSPANSVGSAPSITSGGTRPSIGSTASSKSTSPRLPGEQRVLPPPICQLPSPPGRGYPQLPPMKVLLDKDELHSLPPSFT